MKHDGLLWKESEIEADDLERNYAEYRFRAVMVIGLLYFCSVKMKSSRERECILLEARQHPLFHQYQLLKATNNWSVFWQVSSLSYDGTSSYLPCARK